VARMGKKAFPWQLIVVLILVAAGLFSLSRVFYHDQLEHARLYKENELTTVAGMKALQLAAWRDGHLALARTVSEDRYAAMEIQKVIGDPAAEPAATKLRESLKTMTENLRMDWAAIILPGGRVVIKYPESAAITSTTESLQLGHEAWQTLHPVLGTIYTDEKSGRRSIEVHIPLSVPSGATKEPVALLRVSYDPAVAIDPLLGAWPVSSPTSEIMLVRREDGKFISLGRPRLFLGPSVPGPMSLESFRRGTSKKALGEEGLVEGTDYRGRQVLAFIKAVPGTPWLVIAKVDLEELTEDTAGFYRLLTAISAGFVLLCGVLLALLWRRTMAAQKAQEAARRETADKNMGDFMQVMIDIMPNPAFIKDTEGRYRGTNSAFEKLLGLSKRDLVGKSISDVAPAEIVAKHQQHDQALLAAPGHEVYEAPLKAWDGEHHVIFIKTTYIHPDGTIGGIVGILKDITQRLRSEEELDQLRRFSESIAQTMTEGLVLTGAEGKFTFVNPAAARMLGYTPDEMVDREVLSFVPRDQHPVVRHHDEKRAKGLADRYELVFLHRDGGRRTFLVSGGPRIQGAQFGGTMAVLTDFTDRKQMEEEIRALSLHDELTSLSNRRGFMTLADHALKTANRMKKTVALIYLDVDNLKKINDTGGHRLGDRALVEIAFILKKSFRESDIIGRLGGDEFCVLAMESNKMNVDVLTSRLQEKLEFFNARSSAEAGFRLSVSFGVSTREPDRPEAIEEMLSRADLLMYEQKRSKKGGMPDKGPGPSKEPA
jgi:diguanylate cyclase (GGDEF)-like protein/PAS domain S-box-containing protein